MLRGRPATLPVRKGDVVTVNLRLLNLVKLKLPTFPGRTAPIWERSYLDTPPRCAPDAGSEATGGRCAANGPSKGCPPEGTRSAAPADRHAQRSELGTGGTGLLARQGSPIAKRCAQTVTVSALVESTAQAEIVVDANHRIVASVMALISGRDRPSRGRAKRARDPERPVRPPGTGGTARTAPGRQRRPGAARLEAKPAPSLT